MLHEILLFHRSSGSFLESLPIVFLFWFLWDHLGLGDRTPPFSAADITVRERWMTAHGAWSLFMYILRRRHVCIYLTPSLLKISNIVINCQNWMFVNREMTRKIIDHKIQVRQWLIFYLKILLSFIIFQRKKIENFFLLINITLVT